MAQEVKLPYNSKEYTTINCKLGDITDIVLQPKEKVQFIGGGDTNNWAVDKRQEGHIAIKPLQNATESNFIITTDKNVYHFNLSVSERTGIKIAQPQEIKLPYNSKEYSTINCKPGYITDIVLQSNEKVQMINSEDKNYWMIEESAQGHIIIKPLKNVKENKIIITKSLVII